MVVVRVGCDDVVEARDAVLLEIRDDVGLRAAVGVDEHRVVADPHEGGVTLSDVEEVQLEALGRLCGLLLGGAR